MKPKIGVMYAPGTNCHEETAFAIGLAGGEAVYVLLGDLLAKRASLASLQGLVFPGGFSFGDHIAAGRVYAVHLIARLGDELRRFLQRRRPILGICNGDQILMETGLLPGEALGERLGALTQNRSARFEGRWVTLAAAGESFWRDGLSDRHLRLPSAHGEGRLMLAEGVAVHPAFHYVDGRGGPTERYPDNPSGSPGGIAGLTDGSGLVLGLMPHPERAVLPAHGSEDGRGIFANMVRYCAQS
ncbi:MAG: phosphoribosylformylglycinamidine synthase subunit PurQ [Bacteroidota bacterium]